MSLTTTNGRVAHAVVVPKSLREKDLHAAHDLSGHFGIKKYVGSCNACQKFSKASPPKAPLIPPEIIVERFNKIAVDVVGPLVKSKRGYILTAIDFAHPMRWYTSEEMAMNLLKLFSFTGPPSAILSDQ